MHHSITSSPETNTRQTAPAVRAPAHPKIVIVILLFATSVYGAYAVWFWRIARQNINIDAIAYIGIARHLRDGNLHASLHGYWSPLISWLIAAASIHSSNFTLVGHAVTMASFLACLPLLYWLTLRLWGEHRLAGLSVLWFILGRGVAAESVSFIGADFLLTAFVILYFGFLLHSLRENHPQNWLILGAAHALAFLAKGFAMPWLLLATLLGCTLRNRTNVTGLLTRLACAICIPLLVWMGWGFALKSKYGVFTAGYQLKWNLLDAEVRNLPTQMPGPSLISDYRRSHDAYLVGDSMYPGSPLWNYRPNPRETMRLILSRERSNVPRALKEIAILITPGGIVAILLAAFYVRGKELSSDKILLIVVLFCAATLVLGYCMLVFDGRYVIPLAPPLISIAAGFVLPKTIYPRSQTSSNLASVCAFALLAISAVFFQMYWASPLQSHRRDYQLSCYDAAEKLESSGTCRKLVVIGKGPYPEHGVGWEAGFYSAYFAGCQMIGFAQNLPTEDNANEMAREVKSMHPDALVVFADTKNRELKALLQALPNASVKAVSIRDPQAGDVGVVVSMP